MTSYLHKPLACLLQNLYVASDAKKKVKAGLSSMEKLEIKDITLENIDHFANLCIPMERRNDAQFIKGAKMKKKWATEALKAYGSIAKLAYLDSKPVGLIQYQLNPAERIVEISCIFVPEKANSRKGIGKSLFKALIEDAKKPQPLFDNEVPDALVTWAFQVPKWYPQHKFYQRMGFKRVKTDDPFLLYHPLKKGYVYRPKERKYLPQEEDQGKAFIFYDPSCPFAIHFAHAIKKSIREVAPGIPIGVINKFEELEQVKKRGQALTCAVNRRAIQTFFMDKENFQKEVKQALSSSDTA
jgi:N-acetylglutamate synthase-like GNAT family acetyltransferase